MDIQQIPALNATLNGTATVLLLAGFVFIKTGRRGAHRACMMSAFAVSTVFLVGYVFHKIAVKGLHTPFAGTGFWRTFYYVMLASHVLLAMVILPLVLVTFLHALKGRFDRHRRWARWTFPIWLYVSITGVLVYCFLYRWFPVVG